MPQSGRLLLNETVSISCRVGNSVEMHANVRTNVLSISFFSLVICLPHSCSSWFKSKILYLIDDEPVVVVFFNFAFLFFFQHPII